MSCSGKRSCRYRCGRSATARSPAKPMISSSDRGGVGDEVLVPDLVVAPARQLRGLLPRGAEDGAPLDRRQGHGRAVEALPLGELRLVEATLPGGLAERANVSRQKPTRSSESDDGARIAEDVDEDAPRETPREEADPCGPGDLGRETGLALKRATRATVRRRQALGLGRLGVEQVAAGELRAAAALEDPVRLVGADLEPLEASERLVGARLRPPESEPQVGGAREQGA